MLGTELADPGTSPEVKRHRALGAPTRLRILELLGEHPRSVSAVAAAVGVSVSAASRHLALLADAGLVRRERRGLRVICRRTEAVAAIPSNSAEAGGLRAESVDAVRLYLAMGVSVMRYSG